MNRALQVSSVCAYLFEDTMMAYTSRATTTSADSTTSKYSFRDRVRRVLPLTLFACRYDTYTADAK